MTHGTVDLDYPEARPPELDLESIRRTGRRIRRRQRAGVLAAAVGFVAVVAVVTVAVVRPESNEGPAMVRLSPPANCPPVAGYTLVARPAPGWSVYIWTCPDGEAYYESVGPVSEGGVDGGSLPYAAELAGRLGRPIFIVDPMRDDRTLALGFTPPQTATVSATMFGHTVTAPVTRVATGRYPQFGAYSMWFPLDGHRSWSSSDVTSVVVRDAAGHVIDRLP